ncbi:MAG: DNA polymerase III subunit epsilon [Pseudomonadales bacterium]|nr:DNA polymerase III subunit epsilon [Pseudomonadales bacterium]
MRQVVLDTETTGLETAQGHRIIEIGCVEMINRELTGRHYHQYINPQREVDAGALEVHNISNEFLADKPLFSQVAGEFLEFIRGAELVIHNAAFDIGFMDYEFAMLNPSPGKTSDFCTVLDTLLYARKKHPGQKNNLDALCKRYGIDNSHRELHGALLDAEILAVVYLAMTGGQTALMLDGQQEEGQDDVGTVIRLDANRPRLPVIKASDVELTRHADKLAALEKGGAEVLWRRFE